MHAILIVDDDPCLLGLLRLHLQNAGYCVHVAEDVVVAGRMLLSCPPDLPRAMALGAAAFLTKPVLADQLLAAVARQIPDSRFAIG
jgi:DNA-binding response OmpR family regulator